MNNNKISYFNKDKISCPVCGTKFHLENHFTGQGRLNSQGLTNDLRRLYSPTKKFGMVYPLIYHNIVCPECWFSALPEDFYFDAKKPTYDLDELKSFSEARKAHAQEIFPEVNFAKSRNLESGLISHFLAIASYQHYHSFSLKTAKIALLALRASWVIDDIIENSSHDAKKMKYLKEYFRFLAFKKFSSYYEQYYSPKKSKFIEINYHGPDIDYDYGYKAFMYIFIYLSFEFVDTVSPLEEKIKVLNRNKITLAKIFGLGRSSKKNPSPFLENSRAFYEVLKNKIEELAEELPA